MSFTVAEQRLRATEIEERYPGLLDGLVRHPGVSFVLVDSVDGPLALGAGGVRYLRDGPSPTWLTKSCLSLAA